MRNLKGSRTRNVGKQVRLRSSFKDQPSSPQNYHKLNAKTLMLAFVGMHVPSCSRIFFWISFWFMNTLWRGVLVGFSSGPKQWLLRAMPDRTPQVSRPRRAGFSEPACSTGDQNGLVTISRPSVHSDCDAFHAPFNLLPPSMLGGYHTIPLALLTIFPLGDLFKTRPILGRAVLTWTTTRSKPVIKRNHSNHRVVIPVYFIGL